LKKKKGKVPHAKRVASIISNKDLKKNKTGN